MVYIFNTNLRPQDKTRKALQQVHGLGPFLSNLLCDQLGLKQNHYIRDLKQYQVNQLTRLLNQYFLVGVDLKRSVQNDVKRFIRIGSYKGFRHVQALPVRGQRTHTNAQTVRRRAIIRTSQKSGPSGTKN